MRTITIRPALNGWIVDVGCQVIVFTDKEVMLKELSDYIDDPQGVEKRYIANAVNKDLDPPRPEREMLDAQPYVGAVTPVGRSRP